MGFTFTFLIGAYIWQESRVNEQLRNSEHQYILTSKWKDESTAPEFTTAAPLAQWLAQGYPNLIIDYYRWDGLTVPISVGDKNFRENIQIGDSNLLSTYGFELIQGNPETALDDPFSVLIVESTAIKYFGRTNVESESITIANSSGEQHDFKITGVLKDIPQNSVTDIAGTSANTIFLSVDALTYFNRNPFEDWNHYIIPSYVTFEDKATIDQVAEAANLLVQQNAPPAISENLTIVPVSLEDFYYDQNDSLVGKSLMVMIILAALILIMSLVNYINISIACSNRRLTEVGILKVLGSSRRKLVLQFLFESLIYSVIAVIGSCISYLLLKDWFATLIGKQLPELGDFSLLFPVYLLGGIVIISIIFGLYPALVLSNKKVVDSLKGTLIYKKSNNYLRKGLLVLQYSLSLVFLVCSYFVGQQLEFFFSNDLGYSKEAIITAPLPRDWSPEGVASIKSLRDEFESSAQVVNSSVSYEIMNGANGFSVNALPADGNPDQEIVLQALVTDENFSSVYGLELLSGSYFTSTSATNAVVINEKTAEKLGFINPQEATGHHIQLLSNDVSFETAVVSGVVSDFHFGSKRDDILPQIIFNLENRLIYRYMSFKLPKNDLGSSIAAIEKQWSILLPGTSFEYQFVDDSIAELYATELRLKKAAFASSIISIILVMLGLFALISLSINHKQKELGIRKVLGAKAKGLYFMFLKEFIVVLIVSVLIAFPIAYFVTTQWLQEYSYKIDISIDPFIVIAILITLGTLVLVFIQTARIIYRNPNISINSK
jgi:ABC-type antimicrobial peptide transport system permease subunit